MMDLYIPRKWLVYLLALQITMCFPYLVEWKCPSDCYRFCIFFVCACSSATNRLITAKDHASVQINIGHLDENGIYTGQYTTIALCGFIRSQVHFPSPNAPLTDLAFCLLLFILFCVLLQHVTSYYGQFFFCSSVQFCIRVQECGVSISDVLKVLITKLCHS